ncbi:MAG: response regulator [Herminiimonas sp.]|nr:response regulator [Herminiimonas sp.]
MSARILIIEDNAPNMELMRYLLEAFGHTVVTACDGVEGLTLAHGAAPDLIICDIHLPKLDGLGVIRHLKSNLCTHVVPVVAVTAQAMVGDRDKLLGAGFDGYLCKPIDPECFVKQVDAFLPAPLRSVRLHTVLS